MEVERWDEARDGPLDEAAMRRKLEAGDCLAVPRGTLHRAEVVGDEPVVSLDATRG